MLVFLLSILAPQRDPRLVRERYWSASYNKTNSSADNRKQGRADSLAQVFRQRRDHLDRICTKFRIQKEQRSVGESIGHGHEHRAKVRNWKAQRGGSDPSQYKHPVLTQQEYYFARDKRLNQKVLMTSHLMDAKRKVMYCWNHKVASSFWMWIFTKIDRGEDPPAGQPTYNIQYRMSPKSPSSYQSAVSNYVNILLVRHPLERILSAYRDRIAGLKGSYDLYKKMAGALHLRRVDTSLEYSVKRKNKKGKMSMFNYTKPVAVPTWPEFVRYLLKTQRSQDVSRRDIMFCFYPSIF